MAGDAAYLAALSDTLTARAEWLDKSEMGTLKEDLRAYHSAFTALYRLYLMKGLVHEDPYKEETNTGELGTPDAGPLSETNRTDQISVRLSSYESQLDHLVNFYQFSADFLTLDRIKRILALVRYIDWAHLTSGSASPVTQAVAELTAQIKNGADSLTVSIIGASLSGLGKVHDRIIASLKTVSDYRREVYKLKLRQTVTGVMQAQEALIPQIKKKFAHANPGQPFYPDLAEEVVREDFSTDGPALREKVLKNLTAAESTPTAATAPVSFKPILLEGVRLLSSSTTALEEAAAKLDENRVLLENKKQNLWQKLCEAILRIFKYEPEAVIYEIEYVDPIKGIRVQENLNFVSFRAELDRKLRTLAAAGRGAGLAKLASMQEEQIIPYLEQYVREVQGLHKTLQALDEFFKSAVGRDDQNKVKGIKPELAAVKNAIVRANSKRREYSARKEEEEQLTQLRVKPIV